MNENSKISNYLESALILIWGLCLFLFPLFMGNFTIDYFIFPKQLLLAGAIFLSLIIWAIKMLVDGKSKLRRTPFDLPIFLFILTILFSSIFAINRFDSLISFVPLLFAALSYYLVVNCVKKKEFVFLLFSLFIFGAVLVSLNSILSYFKIYLFPFAVTHSPSFSTLGSLFDQAIYLLCLIPLSIYATLPLLKKKISVETIIFAISTIILTAGLIITVFQLFTTQKPIILPFNTGFQTAFAIISQDSSRTLQSFLLGSGFGTYLTDFTRFRQAEFNLNPTLWTILFTHSSTFILELLATTGILGVGSFLFLIFQIFKKRFAKRNNPMLISLIIITVSAFIFPFSFTSITLLFLLLALFTSFAALREHEDFFDIELSFVALQKGIISAFPEQETKKQEETKLMPVVFSIIFLVFILFFGFYSYKYASAEIALHDSLIAISNNNGNLAYKNQFKAINEFPYKDSYYRLFSQINLTLANSLAASQPKGSTPSASVQKEITTLIQQSINSARNATIISPLTVTNWQNLGSIYKSLIGFGQNAESFAIASDQQAIALDSKNPQNYITLGGVYYQLGQYDNAISAFQTAINLKPDYGNAYYNLGHAYEAKGDLQNALLEYQNVKNLVKTDPNNTKQITAEIEAITQKIKAAENPVKTQPVTNGKQKTASGSATSHEPLQVDNSQTKLPAQKPQVQIPPLTITPSVNITPSISPSPTSTAH